MSAVDWRIMNWELQLVAIPVSDVDRAKEFYVDKVGFNADHDRRVSDEIRFVQLTPPGSACSITFGEGVVDAPPGSVKGMQLVVADIEARRRGEQRPGVPVGVVRVLQRPGRQRLGRAAAARAGLSIE
jgi:catechol 2,3-dioxygenase-like lactoylglutathione lyase family enzyme